jgi:hypothetical protein
MRSRNIIASSWNDVSLWVAMETIALMSLSCVHHLVVATHTNISFNIFIFILFKKKLKKKLQFKGHGT